jgi:hypothetical protein
MGMQRKSSSDNRKRRRRVSGEVDIVVFGEFGHLADA